MKIRVFDKGSRNRDLAIAVLGSTLLFGAFHFFDTLEAVYHLTRQHENLELDEFVLLLLSIPLPVAWFAYRRSQETIRETARRVELERNLAHAHKLESLGTLASGLAHELNNQLLPVTTMAELMRDRMAESDPDRRKMELIVAGASNARKTVSKITVYSRIPKDHSGVCAVMEVCRITEEVLRITCPANARLNFDAEGNIGAVNMAEGDLQGLLVNLVSNAIDALGGKPRQVSMTVSTVELNGKSIASDLTAGNYVRIVVRDTGVGMAPEVCERIFDPFFTTKPVGQGLGLGLAVAYNAIRQARGVILVDSKLGQGTEFTIYLPLIDSGGSMAQDTQADNRIAV